LARTIDREAEVRAAESGTRLFAYTPNQKLAIETIDQNLQIVACAGAGKTDVVSERVVQILRQKRDVGIVPRNIVAFTFTERAGAELKDRIASKVDKTLGEVHGMAEMYVGTIHGWCLQLLQSLMPEYFKYNVLNEVQTRLLVDRASSKTGLKDLGLRRWVESRLYMDVLNVLREADIAVDTVGGHPALVALEKYQNHLIEKRYLDYTEILLQAATALFSDQVVRERLSQQVRYLIVDEYQDVNPLQEALISALHDLGANLCVVGDDDQTIYQWRGSNVRNILGFAERYPNVKTIPIEENYRSSNGVVEAARQLIVRNDPERLAKTMTSADNQTYERGDLLCLTFNSPDDEARWIAQKVKSMIGVPFRDAPDSKPRGLAPSDFAVLLRSVRKNGDPIVRALKDGGVPVVVVGMTGLFDTLEAQAAVALFDFMARRLSKQELVDAWLGADLVPDGNKLDSAVAELEKQREWDDTQRWSVYNLQRSFLGFLEELGIREESIPDGEVVYYNLGKFSQVISDYEQIHFHSDPERKYEGFAEFLEHQAPGYYPEGWQDAGYAQPDAVQVMTVHQAKGMEWPVVFVPSLQRNRFPARRPGGKGLWHVIPRAAVRNADGYDGSVADERRLFYVALTRSKRYVFCSWAPDHSKKGYAKPSQFVSEFASCPKVLTSDPRLLARERLTPKPRREVANVALSFSELKYFFECPYQFKLRFMYGFNPPLHEALGYGKSLHDALAEVHKRAQEGDFVALDDAPELVDRHLNTPFAYDELRQALRKAGVKAVKRYLTDNGHLLDKVEHVEQVVEINLGDGLVVNGRIDLIRRTDTREIIIVDFKSSDRAQEEDVSRMQLHVYALGYRQLTGTSADLIEIYNLDPKGIPQRELVDPVLEKETARAIEVAGDALRENRLGRLEKWSHECNRCDLSGICRKREYLQIGNGH
jgi:DNA helicase-2/ATP-dependent DNA helicase PcrA